VQLLYLEGVTSLQDHIVVKFVPQRSSGELRTGKFGKRTKVDAIDSATNKNKQDEA
jgi:hypothetical protein